VPETKKHVMILS